MALVHMEQPDNEVAAITDAAKVRANCVRFMVPTKSLYSSGGRAVPSDGYDRRDQDLA